MTVRAIALVSLAAAALVGCTGKQLQDLGNQAATTYVNAPITKALNELGAPRYQRPLNDLREYTWTTGVYYEPLGGYCVLSLVADRGGTVVDSRMDGTPMGCNRLLAKG